MVFLKIKVLSFILDIFRHKNVQRKTFISYHTLETIQFIEYLIKNCWEKYLSNVGTFLTL